MRVSISLPAALVERLDRAADERGQNRSDFLSDAVEEHLDALQREADERRLILDAGRRAVADALRDDAW